MVGSRIYLAIAVVSGLLFLFALSINPQRMKEWQTIHRAWNFHPCLLIAFDLLLVKGHLGALVCLTVQAYKSSSSSSSSSQRQVYFVQ